MLHCFASCLPAVHPVTFVHPCPLGFVPPALHLQVAASFALATSVPVFLTLRFLLGATEAAAFPGGLAT